MENLDITSAKYVTNAATGQNGCIEIVVNGEKSWVPLDAVGNTEYDEIQRQVASGDLTIADAD